MKKLVSFVLAALLMLSVVAFAASGDPSLVVKDTSIIYNFTADNVNTGKVETYIYLEVIAQGQIDVTVPLFLVFSTDVDGGKAKEPSNYKITNNNKDSAVGVTRIHVTPSGTMELKVKNEFESAVGAHAYDTYMVTLTASGETYDLGKLNFQEDTAGEALTGLSIPKDKEVNLQPEMQTTAISFITGKDQYVQIMTIEYTLGLIYNTVDTVDLPTTSTVTSETVG